MPMTHKRNARQIQQLLSVLGITVPLAAVRGWWNWQAEETEHWALAMIDGNPTEGLCLVPVPSALHGYVHVAPGPATIPQPESSTATGHRHRPNGRKRRHQRP